jgi:protein-L-isoaspartate(D-aspartate) O-methyltransferase
MTVRQTPISSNLRDRLVDDLLDNRPLPAGVERVMRAVPREAFLPGVPLEDAYTDQAVVIKENPGKPLPLSCASVPSVVAMMLGQVGVRPGDNVLEVGAGTGYNAALLAELAGPGRVTTVDVDSDVAVHARTTLNASGYGHVAVIHRDGLLGARENAPYDRIIAAVGIWDIPSTWFGQLADGGRLVLPLRWRGQTRSVALTRRGNTLVSDSMELCGFVPVVGQDGEKTTAANAADTIRLHHDEDQAVSADALGASLDTAPCREVWSEQRLASGESFDGVWLRATAGDDRVCRLEATPEAVKQGLLRRPVIPSRSLALVEKDSLAYLIVRRDEGGSERPFRLGAAAYGPHGEALAQSLIAHLDAWGADRTAAPQLTITLADSENGAASAGHVIVKRESRLALTY